MINIIVINDELIDLYNDEYLKTHPRAKKKPIDRGFVTLNTILSSPSRMIIANYKKKYGKFYAWVIRYYGYDCLLLDDVKIHMKFIRKTKTKSDLDNLSSFTYKALQDAMVETKMIKADDYFVLNHISSDAEYIKGEERVEVYVTGRST